ncbi:MAG: hypothetical protein COA58_07475 [Bacteroidetes bacterium]|nr:MAG: hypothetical protein COA58_07475 [Bacteroidota bacterium]
MPKNKHKMKKYILIIVFTLGYVGVKGQQESNTINKDSLLHLKFASFDKLKKTYSLGESRISKTEFNRQLNLKPVVMEKYKKGLMRRKAAAVMAITAAVSVVYFENQYSKDETAIEPSKGMVFSYMAIMGAAMLNMKGKGIMQLGVNEYNSTAVNKEVPIHMNLTLGAPAFGVSNLGEDIDEQESIALGLGVEAHLYNHWFAYVDGYLQRSTARYDLGSLGTLRWEEKGQSLIVGMGLDYEVVKGLHLIGKYGWGITSEDVVVSIGYSPLIKEEDVIWQAGQLGVGMRYFATNHLAVGANASLAPTTPLFNFGLTVLL